MFGGRDDIAREIDKVDAEQLKNIVTRSEKQILVIGPGYKNIYDFLHTNAQEATELGMPARLQDVSEVVKSYRAIKKETDSYAFLISGVLGFEIGTRDLGPRDYGYEDGLAFLNQCAEEGLPVAILTEGGYPGIRRGVREMTNRVYFGQRPSEYLVWSYILRCYQEKRYIPTSEFMESLTDELLDLSLASQFEDADFHLNGGGK